MTHLGHVKGYEMAGDFEEKRKVLLMLLKEVGEIKGRTRFQKMVFLGQQELGLPVLFDFSKHHYGPYSWDLTETIERMIQEGDIAESIEEFGDAIRYTYRLSDGSSAEIAEPLLMGTAQDTMKKLSTLPLSAILDYVYKRYLPERCKA